MTLKYFNVKNGLTTGNIILNASNSSITASTYSGNIQVTGSANLGAVSNVTITGGTANYVLSTDGSGSLSWVPQSGGSGSPGGSNTQVQFNDSGAFAGNAGLTFDKTTTTFTANNFVATSSANLGAVGNLHISGGINGYVLSTDGAGNLSWVEQGTSTVITAAYMPYQINISEHYLIPANRQGLFTLPIDVGDGTLEIEGILVEV